MDREVVNEFEGSQGSRGSQGSQGSHSIQDVFNPIAKIKELANQQPYHKYNGMWSRHMESASFIVVFLSWLGLFSGPGATLSREGTLLTYEQVADAMGGLIYLQ